MKSLPLVKIEGLAKSYRRGAELVHALEGVRLTLLEREMVALLGRSGSGKTTFLNLLAGWERPDAGTISWVRGNGQNGSDFMHWERVAMIPQSLGLVEELTVRKNIELPLRLTGRLDSEIEAVDDLLSSLGLAELADRYPHQTSLGQQQRTGVARALVARPALLLADEPTDQQDAGWARQVFGALHAATGQGTCVLLATHTEDVTDYADRVVRMQDGRLEPAGELGG